MHSVAHLGIMCIIWANATYLRYISSIISKPDTRCITYVVCVRRVPQDDPPHNSYS
jgi:hypothetical protein